MNTFTAGARVAKAANKAKTEFWMGLVEDVTHDKVRVRFDTRGFSRWCKPGNLNISPIRTVHEYPPIPSRNYDWSAAREDYDEGDLIGHGRTEQAAIDDLRQQEKDAFDCRD